MADAPCEPIERLTAKRRDPSRIEHPEGRTSVGEVARRHALTVAEIEDWRDRFLAGAEKRYGAVLTMRRL